MWEPVRNLYEIPTTMWTDQRHKNVNKCATKEWIGVSLLTQSDN
jgi:hypothetical protein